VQGDPKLVASLEQIAYYQRTGAGVGYGETHPIFYFRRHCHARAVDRNRTRANKRYPAFVQSLRALNAIMYALTGTPLKEPSKTGFPESEIGFKYFSSLLEPVIPTVVDADTDTNANANDTASESV